VTLAAFSNIILALFVAIFTWFLWQANQRSARATEKIAELQGQFNKLNKDLTWFTGSMESHSALMLRLEAKHQNVPVIWWDPNTAAPPSHEHQKHGDSAELKEIYLYVDREFRGYAEGT
jgi:hypothetical protein